MVDFINFISNLAMPLIILIIVVYGFLERKEVFESYLPEEVFKIDNSILETKGNYLIFCISGDSNKASEIINNYIKG